VLPLNLLIEGEVALFLLRWVIDGRKTYQFTIKNPQGAFGSLRVLIN
jgi:hypothetical protein